MKQVRNNFIVIPKNKKGDDSNKRYDIETNIVNSKKRKKPINSDLNKYFIKSLGEAAKDSGWEGGDQRTKEPPLEELGLVKTHQDQEVGVRDVILFLMRYHVR